MRVSVILFVHLMGTQVRLARPGGLPSVVAESVLVRHQRLMPPYKLAWSIEESVMEMQNQSGQHFDPQIVEAS